MEFAVRLRDLKKDYDLKGEVVHALKGISLDIPQGDYVAIMGPSGSGKSTLLNVLGCLDRPTSGEYLLGEEDVAKLDDERLSAIRASHIGFVFQSYNLIPQLNVLENIETPLYYQGQVTSKDRNRCRQLAKRVGLDDRTKHRPMELSGGQQQRASIARSLVNTPQFVLADEPTGNLDSETAEEILDIFDQLNREGTTIILVTHEEEVAQHTRRIIRLKDGLLKSDNRLRSTDPHATETKQISQTAQVTSMLTYFISRLLLRMRAITLGAKSLSLHPMRSLLTVLGIFIGVASVIWLLAIGEGISSKAQEQIAELGATNIILSSDRPPIDPNNRQSAPYGVTLKDYQRLEKLIPTVEGVAPVRELVRREMKYKDRILLGRLVGCTPTYKTLNHLESGKGHFLTDVELSQERKVCVLSAEVAKTLFTIENPIGKAIHIDQDYYRVVGIVKDREATSGIQGSVSSQDFSQDVYIPITTLWARTGDFYNMTEDGIPLATRVIVRIRNETEVLKTADAIRKCMDDWHDKEDYQVIVPLELLEQARSTRLMFIMLLGMIAAISLVVGGIGIMNIMLATVTERTREIGIRRALGARRGDITQQFLIETIILSIVGGVTGILGGLTCAPVFVGARNFLESNFPELLETMPESMQTVTPIIVGWSIPLAFGISVVVGVIFGLYPANRAAAMKPIEALRHVT